MLIIYKMNVRLKIPVSATYGVTGGGGGGWGVGRSGGLPYQIDQGNRRKL